MHYLMKKATEPRVRICGLLGMIATSAQHWIPVDYSLEIQSLFQCVAAFVASVEQLQFLQIPAEANIRLLTIQTAMEVFALIAILGAVLGEYHRGPKSR
jgi:hypothetical protein